MRYTNELKTQILELFERDYRIDTVIHAISNGHDDVIRNLLESLIDDPSLYTMKIIKDEGYPVVHEMKKSEYHRRKRVYDKFMIEYDNQLYAHVTKTRNKLVT